jgi:hypothetical protein
MMDYFAADLSESAPFRNGLRSSRGVFKATAV